VEGFLLVHLEENNYTTTPYIVTGPKAPSLLNATRGALPKNFVTYIFPDLVKTPKAPKKSQMDVDKPTVEVIELSDGEDAKEIEHDLTAEYEVEQLLGEEDEAEVLRGSEWSKSMCDSPPPKKRRRVEYSRRVEVSRRVEAQFVPDSQDEYSSD